MTEVWTLEAIDGEREVAIVTGRVKHPLWKKLNPFWWFMNGKARCR